LQQDEKAVPDVHSTSISLYTHLFNQKLLALKVKLAFMARLRKALVAQALSVKRSLDDLRV
jgi:hypothetical protein